MRGGRAMKILFRLLATASLGSMLLAWAAHDITPLRVADRHYGQFWGELPERVGNDLALEITETSSRQWTALTQSTVRLVALPLVVLNLLWAGFGFWAIRAGSRPPADATAPET